MTDIQYDRARWIKHELILLNQALSITKGALSLEIHRGDSSDKYGSNIETNHVFEVMQEAMISGLRLEITKLEDEFGSL